MNERLITPSHHFHGTMSANGVIVHEFPYPVKFLGVKAVATNDSDATLAASGGITIAATTIGDSSDPKYIQPATPTYVAKDTATTWTLDFDGAGGTAAQNVTLIFNYLTGEG